MSIKFGNFDEETSCTSKEYIIVKAQEILKVAPQQWDNMRNNLEQAKIAHELNYLMNVMDIKLKNKIFIKIYDS